MKKLIVLVSFLLICTTASAAMLLADAKNTDGDLRVVVPVYNNSGSALDDGDVVVWDIGSSTGDDDVYITTTTTGDTGLVAGVVQGSIAANETGRIVVYGFSNCDTDTALNGAIVSGTLLCTGGVAGAGDACTSGEEYQAYAIANATIAANSSGNCFVIKHK